MTTTTGTQREELSPHAKAFATFASDVGKNLHNTFDAHLLLAFTMGWNAHEESIQPAPAPVTGERVPSDVTASLAAAMVEGFDEAIRDGDIERIRDIWDRRLSERAARSEGSRAVSAWMYEQRNENDKLSTLVSVQRHADLCGRMVETPLYAVPPASPSPTPVEPVRFRPVTMLDAEKLTHDLFGRVSATKLFDELQHIHAHVPVEPPSVEEKS